MAAESIVNTDPASHLADLIRPLDKSLLLVVTGAGVSLASGIPTFRGTDPGAIWKRDVTELGTFGYFRHDPAGSWQWYMQRFDLVLGARPNAAHDAIAALERWQLARGGDFLLVTQNIDTLHEQAGSERMIKVHGSADRVRCSRDGCRLGSPAGSLGRSEIDFEPFLAAPGRETVPRCPECGSLLRQHVLWFDEVYTSHADYQWERVLRALDRVGLSLCIGTSFAVGFTEAVLQASFWNGSRVVAVDPGEPPLASSRGFEHLRAPAEVLLPAVCAHLGARE
jgi:NAD-dependent deacetylase